MRTLALAGLAALSLALAGSAGAASAPPLRGTVVGSQHGTLLVASSRGVVRAVAGRARIGARVSVSGGRLTTLGTARHALIRGIVIRRHGGLTFLGASHHVLVLRGMRTLSSARDTQPAPGSVVQSTVLVDDQGDLTEEDEHAVGQASNTEVQAVVTAVAPGSITLTVNGQPLSIPLPAGLTLPSTLVGTTLTLKLEFAGGTATVGSTAAGDDDQGDDEQDDDDVTTGTAATGAATSVTVQGGRSGGDGRHGGGGGDD